LRELVPSLPSAGESGGESNNHIHTIYSFSPYSPSMAALRAREASLEVAGSVDHDSISAAAEMTAACALLGLGSVTGCEIRVDFGGAGREKGVFGTRKINNPDSAGIVYMTIQGVPAPRVPDLDRFLAPIRARRLERTREMARAASTLLEKAGAEAIDFEAMVVARSKAAEGGGVTERHLLAAVADRMIAARGRGPGLLEFLETRIGIRPPARLAPLLADPDNPYLLYDILGVLKSGFLDRIFIQPDGRECPPAAEAVEFARGIGAIPAYAYLGDVSESPTGDKRAERFEDGFLEELFSALRGLGFLAVTYMPPRNTRAQLTRVRSLCETYGLMEISGVDINQPRQSFNCPELRLPEFRRLGDATWALVAHERLVSVDSRSGLFSPDGPIADRPLSERVTAYGRAGLSMDLSRPDAAGDLLPDLAKGRFSR